MKVSRIYIIIINNCQLFDSDSTENKDVIICDFIFYSSLDLLELHGLFHFYPMFR